MNIARRSRIGRTALHSPVMAFLNGAPTYSDGPNEHTRWHSFLSKPIRYRDKRLEAPIDTNIPIDAYIPVGVLSLSSMRSESTGSLNPRDKENAGELFRMLEAAGDVLFSPTRKNIFEEAISTGVLEWDE